MLKSQALEQDIFCDELYEIQPPVRQVISQRAIIESFKKPQLKKGKDRRDQGSYINRFTERHLIESLCVGPNRAERSVMFFNMLNQGNKRGKET